MKNNQFGSRSIMLLRRILFAFEWEIQIWQKVRCDTLCTSRKIQVQSATLAKCPKIIDPF